MRARRVWVYRGHRCDVSEGSDGIFAVLVGRVLRGAKATEPEAVALAYRVADRLADDQEIASRVREVTAQKAWVSGDGWSAERSIGDPAWTLYRGSWRRGIVVKVTPTKVTTAILVSGSIRRHQVAHDQIVMASI